MQNEKWVTWGLLALIAWELWGRSPGVGAPQQLTPPGTGGTAPGWIQTLGSTYYENSYTTTGPSGPFRFCGGTSIAPPSPLTSVPPVISPEIAQYENDALPPDILSGSYWSGHGPRPGSYGSNVLIGGW